MVSRPLVELGERVTCTEPPGEMRGPTVTPPSCSSQHVDGPSDHWSWPVAEPTRARCEEQGRKGHVGRGEAGALSPGRQVTASEPRMVLHFS